VTRACVRGAARDRGVKPIAHTRQNPARARLPAPPPAAPLKFLLPTTHCTLCIPPAPPHVFFPQATTPRWCELTLLVLDLRLDVVDGVRGLHLQGDGFTRDCESGRWGERRQRDARKLYDAGTDATTHAIFYRCSHTSHFFAEKKKKNENPPSSISRSTRPPRSWGRRRRAGVAGALTGLDKDLHAALLVSPSLAANKESRNVRCRWLLGLQREKKKKSKILLGGFRSPQKVQKVPAQTSRGESRDFLATPPKLSSIRLRAPTPSPGMSSSCVVS
jgi:hypothetical protein